MPETADQPHRFAALGRAFALDARDAETAWWVDKSGGAHYAEHLPRLSRWVAELVARRPIG